MRCVGLAHAICGLLLVSGCAEDEPSGDTSTSGDVGTTSSTTGDSGTSHTSGASGPMTSTTGASSADGTESTSGASETGASTSTGSGSASDSTGTASDGGDGPTTGGQGAMYSARALFGGLDRVEIRKADHDNDRCMWLRIVRPAQAGQLPGVTTPMDWAVEQISINDVATSCDAENPGMFGAEQATGATGSVSFGGELGQADYPCEVDVDVEAQFAGMLPGIPPSDTMNATGIEVDGAC